MPLPSQIAVGYRDFSVRPWIDRGVLYLLLKGRQKQMAYLHGATAAYYVLHATSLQALLLLMLLADVCLILGL